MIVLSTCNLIDRSAIRFKMALALIFLLTLSVFYTAVTEETCSPGCYCVTSKKNVINCTCRNLNKAMGKQVQNVNMCLKSSKNRIVKRDEDGSSLVQREEDASSGNDGAKADNRAKLVKRDTPREDSKEATGMEGPTSGQPKVVVYLLVTSNLCTTILAIVLAVQIWRTRKFRKGRKRRRADLSLGPVTGRPPAELPPEAQGGQRRDSFPYGHYQRIRDENLHEPGYSEPLTEQQIFRLVMSAVHKELLKAKAISPEARRQLIRGKTKLLVEEYIDPVQYGNGKTLSDLAASAAEDKHAKEGGKADTPMSVASSDYSSTITLSVMREIQEAIAELLPGYGSVSGDRLYGSIPGDREETSDKTENVYEKTAGDPKEKGGEEERLLSPTAPPADTVVYEALP